MTTPREEQPPSPADGPSVTTAPPRARWNLRFGRVPSHIGPARTSTLVLAVLFVAVFVLWLYVRPPSAQVGTAGGEGSTGGGSGQVEQTTPTTRATTATTTRPPTRTSTPTRTSPSAPTTTAPGAPTTATSPSARSEPPTTTTSAGTGTVPPQPSGTVAPSS